MMSPNYHTKEMFSAAATQWRCWLQWTHSHSTSESQFQGWKTPKLIVFGHNGLFNNGSSCHCVGCWVLGCSYQWANFCSPLPPLPAPHCCLLGSLVSTQLGTQLTSSSHHKQASEPIQAGSLNNGICGTLKTTDAAQGHFFWLVEIESCVIDFNSIKQFLKHMWFGRKVTALEASSNLAVEFSFPRIKISKN